MRKLLLLVALFVCDSSMAQSPEKFTYQSVIRDEAQNLILDSNVGIQIIIRKDSPSGTIIFKEQHTVTTNQNGLATLEIGSGAVITGMFSSIDWSNGPYFIETGTDPLGGTNFTIIGVSQFLSVPYALHSKTAENVFNDQVDDADNNPTNEIQDISLNGTELSITNGNTIDISVLQDGVNDADNNPTNEIQDISLNGTELSITNGSTIDISALQDGVNDADSDPNNEIQSITLSNDTLYISNGGQVFLGDYGIDLVDDADNDTTNEIELPSNANLGDLLKYDGNSWIAAAPTGSTSGALMYIYDGQTCPAGWSTQQINVAVFGGVPVDACYTDTSCLVMYIYHGQTCPAGWSLQPINAPVTNGNSTPVDACYKCY